VRRIIYISRSCIGEDQGALDAIVKAASARNAARGITGMLWSDEREFVQALEGDDDAVSETMQRIREDRRHADIEVVCDRVVRSRLFGTWAMAVPDQGPDAIASTAYLVGFGKNQGTPTARRIVDMLLAADT
jgi:hypothetical protein